MANFKDIENRTERYVRDEIDLTCSKKKNLKTHLFDQLPVPALMRKPLSRQPALVIFILIRFAVKYWYLPVGVLVSVHSIVYFNSY